MRRRGASVIMTRAMVDDLRPETLLVRAPALVLRLGDADVVKVEIAGEIAEVGPIALKVLDAFAKPRAMGDVLRGLAAEGPDQFIEASTAAVQLARVGALVPPGTQRTAKVKGFVRPAIHLEMLDDEARTAGYCQALARVVGPEDVVIDIGTGTGVLAVAAAKAGARRVYAIESSGIADLASRVFEANGVTDRVELVRGRSTHVTLPEKGTVLVTETIGNDPLDETLLEIVRDARARLLVDGARIIPSALELHVFGVDVPAEVLGRHAASPDHVARWRAKYGIDLAPLVGHRLAATQPFAVETEVARQWPRVTPVVPVARLELERSFETRFERNVELVLDADVARLGIVLAFRAELAPGIVISVLPDALDPKNCWRWAIRPAFDCLQNARGQKLAVAVAYASGETALTTRRL